MTPKAIPAAFALGLLAGPFACSWGAEVRLGGVEPNAMAGATPPPPGAGGASGGNSTSSGGSETGGQGGAGGVAPAPVRLGTIRPILELNTDAKEDNPTLTEDELIICFTSNRDGSTGGTDIWCAERASKGEPFSTAVERTEVNTSGFESSPVIEFSGLALWFSSEVDGQLDIFRATRQTRAEPFGDITAVAELNSDVDDLARPLARSGQVMPMASRRDQEDYWTYLATRPSANDPFGPPELITELAHEGESAVDAVLFEDGHTILFTAGRGDGAGDIYVARRPRIDEPFGEAQPIAGLDTAADERDPFLSPDASRLYFASDRDGNLDLFVAEISWLTP
jgi:WD40-like Beta Propeller Repeat